MTLADPLLEALVEYESVRDRGEPVDHQAFLARFPDLAGQLAPLLEAADRLDALTKPFRHALRREPPTFPDLEGYEILSELGRGGMGVVYKARQKGTEQLVALKMLRPDWGDPDAIEQFRREVRAAARLRHPNCVRILAPGEHQGRPFYVMELIEGRTLADKVRDTGVKKADAVRYLCGVAEALAEAHRPQGDRPGILHRDVKPQNVLIDSRTDQALLTDFGLAVMHDPTNPGARQADGLAGTLPYVAPEQITGEATAASDVYGLGATLYELLVGEPPVAPRPGETSWDFIQRIFHEKPIPPRQRKAGVSREIDRICMKCLRKNPAERYQSAFDLADDLRRYLQDVAFAGHFTSMGAMFVWLGPIVLLLNVAVYFLIQEYATRPNVWIEVAVWSGIFGMYPTIFSVFALAPPPVGREHYLSRLELWSVWGGKMFAAVAISIALRAAFPQSPQTAMRLVYVVFAALSGMAVFALVTKMARKLYVLPAGAWAAGIVMVYFLDLAPLLYGAYACAGVVVYGLYLRNLGRELS